MKQREKIDPRQNQCLVLAPHTFAFDAFIACEKSNKSLQVTKPTFNSIIMTKYLKKNAKNSNNLQLQIVCTYRR